MPQLHVVATASVGRAGKENPLSPKGHINRRFLDDLPSCCVLSMGGVSLVLQSVRGRILVVAVRRVSGTARGNLRFSVFCDVARRIVVVGPRLSGQHGGSVVKNAAAVADT